MEAPIRLGGLVDETAEGSAGVNVQLYALIGRGAGAIANLSMPLTKVDRGTGAWLPADWISGADMRAQVGAGTARGLVDD